MPLRSTLWLKTTTLMGMDQLSEADT